MLLLGGCNNPEPIAPVDCTTAEVAPLPMQRLSANELTRTVRDLFGVTLDPTRELVPDARVDGFDNQSTGQHTSPLHVERFFAVAEEVAAAAVLGGDGLTAYEAEALAIDGALPVQVAGGLGTWAVLPHSGEAVLDLDLPHAGTFDLELVATAYELIEGTEEPDQLPVLTVRTAAGTVTHTFESADPSAPDRVRVSIAGEAGPASAVLTLSLGRAWGVAIDRVELHGTGPEPAHPILTCGPEAEGAEACARTIFRPWLRRLWRRAITEEDLTAVVDLVVTDFETYGAFDEAVALGLQAAMLAPDFLFLAEGSSDDQGAAAPTEGFVLASRLSYFLWSSAPDDTLLDCAEAGTLRDDEEGPCGLRAQVDRMLDDDRADALVESFALHWLGVADLETLTRDPDAYPDFDVALARAMKHEVRLLLRDSLREDRALEALLAPGYTWADHSLAALYVLPDQDPTEGFVKVPTADLDRDGLLGAAGILTATSQANRTSPVKRGVWVLAQLMCDDVGAPPPDVPPLPEGTDPRAATEQHTDDPLCASCHERIDPIGFSLEHYDAIGGWRNTIAGHPVDAHGELPDGSALDGAPSLARYLAVHGLFETCAERKLAEYALRRTGVWEPPEPFQPGRSLRELVRDVAVSGALVCRETSGGNP